MRKGAQRQNVNIAWGHRVKLYIKFHLFIFHGTNDLYFEMNAECSWAFQNKIQEWLFVSQTLVSGLTYVNTIQNNNKVDLEKLMKLVNLMENNRKFTEVVGMNNDCDGINGTKERNGIGQKCHKTL